MALRRRQDHAAGRDAVVHRVRERLLDTQLGAVEDGSGAAEREDAGRLRRVVANEPGHHGGGRRLGQHEPVRRVVRNQVRVVDGGQQRADDARDGRRRDDVDLRAGMSPDRHALELTHQQFRHFLDAAAFLGQLRLLRGRVVERLWPAEERHLGLQVVDPIQGLEDREDEVGVVLAVRNGCGKVVPHPMQQCAVGSFCHAVRPMQPPYHSIPRPGRGPGVRGADAGDAARSGPVGPAPPNPSQGSAFGPSPTAQEPASRNSLRCVLRRRLLEWRRSMSRPRVGRFGSPEDAPTRRR